MNGSRNEISPARQAVAMVCAIIAVMCAIGIMIINSQESKEDAYRQCLTEERARIAVEGSLLEAEDFCDIGH
ncbi:hypothetical protein BAY61_05815 [Prauserella marina]|uniref:Uncharacterized protein n=1 Tax=Prauserella marina TaxID=530584 RepID=A0A222VLJ2_9PSEU|nr:hypothetical protein [Prauserella marina]ASR34581.1 hypothetical protein BAY61_05815 [Prauserella marina]PWV85792.1 hypothetical protein DES30_1011822 [Prauserella marina]SDC45413.1 hypothetical protein SAMN05421630_102170 [Prauserella marina]